MPRPALGSTEPAFQLVKGFLPDGKRARHDLGNSPPSCAMAKNGWRYTCTPPYAFMAWTATAILLFSFVRKKTLE